MPTIILNEIRCYDPVGSRDDMMLWLVTEEDTTGQMIWGPERMRAGNTINLRDHTLPIVYEDFARISLYEHDTVGRNDYFGTMSFSPHSAPGTGSYFFPGELNARYRVDFEVLAEPAPAAEHQIEIVSIRCNNPQGTRDEISLDINDRMVFGPGRTMREDWQVDFTDLIISFRRNCIVTLRETQGQDWQSSFTIREETYTPGRDILEHTFSVDRGIIGDAQYTLRYRLLA